MEKHCRNFQVSKLYDSFSFTVCVPKVYLSDVYSEALMALPVFKQENLDNG